MNIKTQLTQYAAAQQTAQQSHAKLINRLCAAETVIRNIYRKKGRGLAYSREVAWINVFRNPDALIVVTGNEECPVTITHGGSTYHIPRVFIFGSTWDIAKATRQLYYRDRNAELAADFKRLQTRVKTAEDTLERKIAEIRRKADREIENLKRQHEYDFSRDQRDLALRERQVKNVEARLASKS